MTETKKTAATKTTAKKTATPAKKAATKTTAKKAEAKTTVATAKLNGSIYATGKRKDSVARVYLTPGKGKITINGIEMKTYFKRPVLQMILVQPFDVTKRDGAYDVVAMVAGGGLSGQAGAVRHGISRCLDLFEPELHKVLRQGGFLTRDSRAVERKKAGRSKARKRYQFSKR